MPVINAFSSGLKFKIESKIPAMPLGRFGFSCCAGVWFSWFCRFSGVCVAELFCAGNKICPNDCWDEGEGVGVGVGRVISNGWKYLNEAD